MKILIFATDIPPIEGLATSGTALRTSGFARGFQALGHDVLISVPQNALDGAKKSLSSAALSQESLSKLNSFAELAFDAANQGDILRNIDPDLVFCGHWPAMALKTKPNQPLVVDLAGPHLLERHYQGFPDHSDAVLAKLGVLASADYFIVSGSRQRRYFLSFLLRAGVLSPEKRMIEITMPLDPKLPARSQHSPSAESFPRFVFGGVFLPWQDPSAGLQTIATQLKERDTGSLKLIGGKHPNYQINVGKYEKLFEDLSKHPQISCMPMLPFEQFVEELSGADVAVDLMAWNLERELAMTIRSTTYLWAGVPVIYNNYADLGDLISEYDAGWTVDPADRGGLEAIVQEIYSNPELVRQKSQNAQQLASERFSWTEAAGSLLSLLSTPSGISSNQTDILADYPESADYLIYDNNSIEQYFVCRVNGLSKIECRIATHSRESLKPVTFRLFQIESRTSPKTAKPNQQDKTLLQEFVAERDMLHNNEWFCLDTQPVSDSHGKTFSLEIEASSSVERESISPWTIKSSPYPLLGMYYRNKKIEHAGLCLRTTCTGTSSK